MVRLEVIAGATVVEVNDLSILLCLQLLCLGARRGDVGRRAVCEIPGGESKFAMLVQCVVVGHRVRSLWAHDHAFVRLAGVVAGGENVDFDGLWSLECLRKRHNCCRCDLRLFVVFAYLAGDLQGIAELGVIGALIHVDEDAFRRVARVLRLPARACGLQEETVLPALVVHSRDDAFGGHRLALQG